MGNYDWQLSPGAPLCVLSDSFYATSRDTIFRQLTPETTHEQFAAALERLQVLRDELVQQLYPMHYGSLVGRHRYIEHLFRKAHARLQSLEIMQPVPVPQQPAEPPPAPKPEPTSDEELMERLKAYVAERTNETFFGQDQEEAGEEEPQ